MFGIDSCGGIGRETSASPRRSRGANAQGFCGTKHGRRTTHVEADIGRMAAIKPARDPPSRSTIGSSRAAKASSGRPRRSSRIPATKPRCVAHRSGGSRNHRPDPGRSREDRKQWRASMVSISGGCRDRRRPAQRSGRREGGRAHPRRQGRAPDERQPAYRRADAGGTRSATGLRTARRISHVFIMDVPTYARRLSSPTPRSISSRISMPSATSSRTRSISSRSGARTPRVAILSAVETVTPKIPSTIEAAALCKMADRGQITGGILDGPLAFDNAIDPKRRGSRASNRRSRGARKCSSCPTSRPATCSRRT